MAIHFESLRSGSSGNCLMVWTGNTRIGVDCGWESTRACQRALQSFADGASSIGPAEAPLPSPVPPLAAVLLTHLHRDHIGPPALRALARLGVPVFCHERLAGELGLLPGRLQLHTFGSSTFSLGELAITPVPVTHTPGCLTHAFSLESKVDRRRVVIATDLASWKILLEHTVEADFLFVEANHDVQMARMLPVPNSRWHLSNDQTAALIAATLRQSRRKLECIMLGHLSAQRNIPELALGTLEETLRRQELWDPELPVWIAPRFTPSHRVCLEGVPEAPAQAGPEPPGTPVQLSLF